MMLKDWRLGACLWWRMMDYNQRDSWKLCDQDAGIWKPKKRARPWEKIVVVVVVVVVVDA
jgi:hypothetical protein